MKPSKAVVLRLRDALESPAGSIKTHVVGCHSAPIARSVVEPKDLHF